MKYDCGNPIGQGIFQLPEKKPTSGALVNVSCSSNPPNVSGYINNTSAPTGTQYQYELYLNGATPTNDPNPAQDMGGPFPTDTTGNFDLTPTSNPALPAAFISMMGTNSSAPVTLWAQSYWTKRNINWR